MSWQGRIDERGRGRRGGQRQRVVLARALGLDPKILILIEPTSAVDAHTEERRPTAQRLVTHRRGKTTIVTTASPLLLHHADRVAFLLHKKITAYGTHEELLQSNADYRRTVARGISTQPARHPIGRSADRPARVGETWRSNPPAPEVGRRAAGRRDADPSG